MGRQFLLLGIGQTGGTVAELFSRKMQGSTGALAYAIDTDERMLSGLSYATPLSLAHAGNLGTVVEELGAERAQSFFPCDWETDATDFAKGQSMKNGAGLWRAKAYLSFVAFLSDKKKEKMLSEILEKTVAAAEGEGITVRILASLVGGTGSALFLPLGLYVKNRLTALGAKIDSIGARLVLPGVYEDTLSAEQKIKGRANAYAALRELHALDLAADAAEFPPIDFPIGTKGAPLANPFDRVALFDRIPTVSTVQMHLDTLTRLLLCECRYQPEQALATRNENTDNTVYCGTAITVIEYPRDSIAAYIAKKQTYDFLFERIGSFSEKLTRTLEREEKIARSFGKINTDGMATFTATCLSLAEKLEMPTDKDAVPESLGHFLREIAGGEKYTALEELLGRAPVTVHRGALLRGEEKEKLLAYAEELGAAFSDYYATAYEALFTEKEQLVSALFTKEGMLGFSVPSALIGNGDAALPPTEALIRLSSVRESLVDTLESRAVSYHRDWSVTELPSDLFTTPRAKGLFTTRYQKAENRFATLLVDRDEALACDEECFRDDAAEFLSYLYKGFFTEALTTVLMVVDGLIEKYRGFLTDLCEQKEAYAEELRLASLSSSISNVELTSIGATPREKAALYERYRATSGDAQAVDLVATRILCRAALAKDAPTPDSLIASVENAYREALLASDFFREQLDVDLLSAARRRGDGYGSFFAEGVSPLRITHYGKSTEGKRARSATVAILSPAVAQRLKSEAGQDISEEELVQKMLFEGGAQDACALFSEDISPRKMLLYRELSGFALASLDAYNELSADAVAYRAYLRAKATVREQNTQMWNPDLLYHRAPAAPLPHIFSQAQTAYEEKVAKALLFALATEELFLTATEDGKQAYHLRSRVYDGPILLDGKIITQKQYKRLALFAYANEEWTLSLADRYDRAFLAPAQALHTPLPQPQTVAAFLRRDAFEGLVHAFARLVSWAYDENTPPSGFLRVLLCTVRDTVAAYGPTEDTPLCEGNCYLYNAINAAFADRFLEGAARAKGKQILAYLNREGYLLTMTYTGEYRPYTP